MLQLKVRLRFLLKFIIVDFDFELNQIELDKIKLNWINFNISQIYI